MGFDVNRFVVSDQINEDLICNICKGVLEDAVWSPNCEHAFCKVCIQQWLVRRNQCPNDRQSLSQSHLKPIPRFMRNLLDKLEIKCDFSSNGCQQVFYLECLREHLLICDFNPEKRVDCHMGCGVILKKADLQNHNCVKSLRRIVDHMSEECQRSDRVIGRLRSEISSLKNENTLMKESITNLQIDVKKLLEDRPTTGVSHISQSSFASTPLSSTSKTSRVVPNPYVLITPLQSSSHLINDEPSSSTLITSATNRLMNEEPAYKRRTTTIRVASPLTNIRPIASTQPISPNVSLSYSMSSYSPPETIIARSPSPRYMSSGSSLSPTIEALAHNNHQNDTTTITVSDTFPHSYNYINLDDNEETEPDDENTSIEPLAEITDFDIEVQPSD